MIQIELLSSGYISSGGCHLGGRLPEQTHEEDKDQPVDRRRHRDCEPTKWYEIVTASVEIQPDLLFLCDEHGLHPRASPGGFAEKRKAGFDGRVMAETANRNTLSQLNPPVPLDQRYDDGLERDPVQWVAGMGNRHRVAHSRPVARGPRLPGVDGFHKTLMASCTVAVPVSSILQKV
jgi:hypothetical protein